MMDRKKINRHEKPSKINPKNYIKIDPIRIFINSRFIS